MKEELTLEDLSNISGFSLRTLRYYIQEGILQGPDTRGKNASYSQRHLDRIELIRRLKKLHLPLQEISHIVENMTPEEISQIREYQDILKTKIKRPDFPETSELDFSVKQSSALEYIHNLEKGTETPVILMGSNEGIESIRSQVATPERTIQKRNYLSNARQEKWTRIVLREGIELNFRSPLGADEQTRLDRLIEFAQNLFHD